MAATTLQGRIDQALSRVRHPRTGKDIVSSEVVRDVATTTTGKVRLTLLLAPGDDPSLARTVRQALEQTEGVTEVQVHVAESLSVHPERSGREADAQSKGARDACPDPLRLRAFGAPLSVNECFT